jgi:small GTP-binding protein
MKIISKFSFIVKRRLRKKKVVKEKRRIIYRPPFNYDYTFKIILLGDSDVEKEIITQDLCDIFDPSSRLSIGVDFHVKRVEVKGKKIKMQIWDVAGQDRFGFLLPMYCLGANAALIIYDITNPNTIEKMEEWIKIIRERAGNIPVMLIGNKIDLEKFRKIPMDEGIKIEQNYNLSGFSEISTAKVEKMFINLSEMIMNRY